MAAYSRILISAILVLSVGGVQSTSNYSTEHIEVRTRLYRKLLRDYEEDVRPAVNQSQPVIVGFGLSLQQLVKLDEHLQELVLDVMLRKIWADPRLTWEPEDYDGIEHLRIPVVKLWRPDIVLYNNVGDDYALLYDPYATVYHTGAINWTPKAFLRSHCLIDMTNFPFDTQRCTLMFGSWAFTNKEINLTFNPTREESVDVLDYRYSREWDLIDHSYDINHRMFSDFQVVLDFKRNPTFYTHMYLLPALLVAFIAPCVFILPPDSNEKVTLGGILLLTLTLSMSTLQGILPREQFDLPILALYEAITMALIAISIILSIIINGLHHRGPRKKKVPNIIRQIFLHGLKRVTCFGEDSYYPLDEMETISMRGLDRHMTEAESNTKPPESTSTSKLEKDVEQILKHMRGVAIRNSVSDSRADIRSEWQLVAMVIDRLLFGLYVLMIFIATIGVFA